MPVPLILFAGVAFTAAEAAVIGGVIGACLIGMFGYGGYKLWKFMRHKKIAVLGARGVGKTTLHHFMQTGELKASHNVTEQGGKPYKAFQLKKIIDSMNLDIKKGIDVNGGDYNAWRNITKDAEITLYLFDVYKYLNEPTIYQGKIEQDLLKVADFVKNNASKKYIRLVGTHIDCVEGFDENILRSDLFIKSLQNRLGGTDYCELVFGSMHSPEKMEALVKTIFKSFHKE
jgi:hypothetical protein